MKILLSIFLVTILLIVSCNNQDNNKTAQKEDTTSVTNKTEQTTDTTKAKKDVVFRINGKPYFKKDVKNMNIQNAINDAILYETAKIEQKHTDPEYLALIERYKRNILVGRHKSDIIKKYLSTANVTKENMQKYYEDNIDRYTSLDLIKISTLDKAVSEQIYSQLQSGSHPDEIKSQYDNVSVYKMTDEKKYNDKFKTLKKSEITEPIEENKFYNIYFIDDINTQTFERAKRSIKIHMLNQYKQEALRKYIETAKSENNLQVEIVKN